MIDSAATRTAARCLALALVLAGASSARADVFTLGEANWLSNTGYRLYLAGGVLTPLVEDGRSGANHTLRIVDGLLLTTIASEGLKVSVPEERPNHADRESLPSGHTSASFLVATVESGFHPDQAPFWYAGAVLIGASRVRSRWHYTHDVLAGAAIGYGVGRWELSRKRGILLTPLIPRGGAGLLVSATF